MPEALRQRLAERGDIQKLFDAARHMAVTAWRGLAAAVDWIADAIQPAAPVAAKTLE
jgi:hypothetical protein